MKPIVKVLVESVQRARVYRIATANFDPHSYRRPGEEGPNMNHRGVLLLGVYVALCVQTRSHWCGGAFVP